MGAGEAIDAWDRLPADSRVVVGCAAAVLALHLFPYGTRLLYPIEQFVSIVHQTWHALAASVTGGRVVGFELAWNGTGFVKTVRGSAYLTALAGPIGTMAVGAVLLMAAHWRRYAGWWLLGLAIAVLAGGSSLLSHLDSPVPLIGILMGGAFVGIGRRHGETGRDGAKLVFSGAVTVLGGLLYHVLIGLDTNLLIAFVCGASYLAFSGLGGPMVNRGVLALTGASGVWSGLYDLKPLLFGTRYPGLGHSDAITLAHHGGMPAGVWGLGLVGLGMGSVVGIVYFGRSVGPNRTGDRSSGDRGAGK